MKKVFALIVAFATILAFSSCGKKQNTDESVTDNQVSKVTITEETSTEEVPTETESKTEKLSDTRYETAVANLYKEINEIKTERLEGEEPEHQTMVYMTDINSDGYKDIFYMDYDCFWWFPILAVYDNNSGEFVTCLGEEDFEVLGGSLFPSGNEGGYFIDSDKGIVVVRYDGHTTGTIYYRQAQAYKIEGTKAEGIWKEVYDFDYDNPDPRYDIDKYGEDAVEALIVEEYNKQYLPRIADYNLVSFFDVYVPWNGEIL